MNELTNIRVPDPAPVPGKPRRVFKLSSINWPFLLVTVLLVAYGLLVVYSAVSANEDFSFTR